MDDFHQPARAAAGGDEDLGHLQGRGAVFGGFGPFDGADEIDVIAVKAGRDGGLRQGDHALFGGQFHEDADELAGGQLALRIGDRAAQRDKAGGRIDARVDAGDRAVKGLIQPFDPHLKRLTHGEKRQVLFRQAEIDAHGAKVLQRGHDGAGGDILAQIDAGQADGARERRREAALFQHGGGAGELRLGGAGGGLGGVERDIGRHPALGQIAGAGQVRLFQLGLGAGGLDLGGLHDIVKAQEQGACVDHGVGLEQDLFHHPGGFHGQVHALGGVDGADRLDRGGPDHGLRLDRRDGGGLLGHVGEDLGDHAIAEQVEPDKAAPDQAEKQDGEDQTLDHGNKPLLGNTDGKMAIMTMKDAYSAGPAFTPCAPKSINCGSLGRVGRAKLWHEGEGCTRIGQMPM